MTVIYMMFIGIFFTWGVLFATSDKLEDGWGIESYLLTIPVWPLVLGIIIGGLLAEIGDHSE